mmetsp:Transcript_23717/g.55297  ORF Transcript_23717/g.55297 Transcript_23717/m.55297 type:complete len:106 (-) Transcript_23717:28-345(-)
MVWPMSTAAAAAKVFGKTLASAMSRGQKVSLVLSVARSTRQLELSAAAKPSTKTTRTRAGLLFLQGSMDTSSRLRLQIYTDWAGLLAKLANILQAVGNHLAIQVE